MRCWYVNSRCPLAYLAIAKWVNKHRVVTDGQLIDWPTATKAINYLHHHFQLTFSLIDELFQEYKQVNDSTATLLYGKTLSFPNFVFNTGDFTQEFSTPTEVLRFFYEDTVFSCSFPNVSHPNLKYISYACKRLHFSTFTNHLFLYRTDSTRKFPHLSQQNELYTTFNLQ